MIHRYYSRLLLACLFFLGHQLHAAPITALNLAEGTNKILLTPYLEVFKDDARLFDINTITDESAVEFTAFGNKASFMLADSTWWLRFRALPHMGSRGVWDMVLGFGDNSQHQAWIVNARGKVRKITNANENNPLDAGSVNHHRPAYRLNLIPGETNTVYLRLEGTSEHKIPSVLWKPAALEKSYIQLSVLQGAFFGALLTLIGYNLFLYISLRETGYLYLVLATIGFGLEVTLDLGYINSFLPFWSYPDFIRMTPGYIAMIFAMLFADKILELKQSSPSTHKLALAVVAICVIAWLSTFLSLPDVRIALFMGSLVGLATGYAIFITRNSKSRVVRLFIPAVFVSLVTVTPYLLTGVGFLSIDVHSQEIFQAGLVITLLLFSLAQAEKLDQLKESAEWANNELLVQQNSLEHKVRKRTEALAKARDKANAANEAKSHFLANISHEIRTPLNAISGLTHLLEGKENPRYLEKLSSASRSLLSLVDDVLDFSHIESGKLKLEPTEFSLKNVLTDIEHLFSDEAEKRSLGFSINYGADIPATLLGDPARIRQILINLVQNALKFTDKGFICINARLVEDKNVKPRICFEVIDSGQGMDEEFQRDALLPFSQLNSTHARRHGGVGLGLSICSNLLSMMNSKLNIESTPGEGSKFSFVLALKRIENIDIRNQPTISQVEAHPALTGKSVLVVDDDYWNREIARELILLMGPSVKTVSSGLEAIETVRNENIDLVFMDIQMPEMDGYQTVKNMNQTIQKPLPAIIALTAHVHDGDKLKSLSAGMDDYLSKPVNPEKLRVAMLKWLAPESFKRGKSA